MKTTISIGIFLFACLFAWGEKKQKNDTTGMAAIEQLIKSREFYIEVDQAFPMGNSSITINSQFGTKQLGGDGYISLATNKGQLFMLDSIATGHMPFFGRAYSTEYGKGGGIEFEKAKIENESFKKINKRKQHYIEYKFSVRNRSDVFNFYVEAYANGRCNVNITSNNRASISYNGDITAIPQDKREALGI